MKNKIVDGVELLRLIRDGEIKDKQTFKNIGVDLLLTYDNNVLYYYDENLEHNREFFADFGLSSILNCKFEILSEEDEEIDIQALNQYGTNFHEGIISTRSSDTEKEKEFRKYIINNAKDIRTLIRVVKQLDKKIKEEE